MYNFVKKIKDIEIKESDFDRFIKYVKIKNENDCWSWTGTIDSRSYGIFSIKRILFKAHRISYLFWNGKLDDKLEVCHLCDNPICVNPNHLWQGTHFENMKDRGEKGRTNTGHLYGEENPKSKLTWKKVKWIRDNYSPDTWSTRKLAKKFGVCQTKIRQILKNESWTEQ